MVNCKFNNNDNTKNQENITIILGNNDTKLKQNHGDAVYNFLSEKYESIGGINKGRGFKNRNDMVVSIPVWRLKIINNKIASVMMFKVNKYGKKMVAYACTDQAGDELKKSDYLYMMNSSYAELSDGLLVSILKILSKHLYKYVLNAENLMKHKVIHPIKENCSIQSIPTASRKIYERLKEQWPELLSCCYIREIGNSNKLKVIMGTPQQSFTNNLLAFSV